MSNATGQATSTRDDARGFADAFAAADDAFTFGPAVGISRTLTLDELSEALALDQPVVLSPSSRAPDARSSEQARRAAASSPDPASDDDLLTLDELGEVLARPVGDGEDLEFDFGASAHERARRRTAARLRTTPGVRRRVSGPHRGGPTGRAWTSAAETTPGADGSRGVGARRMADDAASAAERMAQAGPRLARGAQPHDAPGRPTFAPAAPRADVAIRRPVGAAAVARLRADPDRMAMWAALLGIVLVLIAFTSGSS